MVAHKDSSQNIKEAVKDLEKSNFKEGKSNKKKYRPWGSFTSIVNGDTWQVKRLEIKPKEKHFIDRETFLKLKEKLNLCPDWPIITFLFKKNF